MLFKFSTSVATSNTYEKVKNRWAKAIDPDRAGAPSNVSLAALVLELKAIHKQNYVADEIYWSIWATYDETT